MPTQQQKHSACHQDGQTNPLHNCGKSVLAFVSHYHSFSVPIYLDFQTFFVCDWLISKTFLESISTSQRGFKCAYVFCSTVYSKTVLYMCPRSHPGAVLLVSGWADQPTPTSANSVPWFLWMFRWGPYLLAPGGQAGPLAQAVRVVHPAHGHWSLGSPEYREFLGDPEGLGGQEGLEDQEPQSVASCLGRDRIKPNIYLKILQGNGLQNL